MNLLRALYSIILAIIGVPFIFPETRKKQRKQAVVEHAGSVLVQRGNPPQLGLGIDQEVRG